MNFWQKNVFPEAEFFQILAKNLIKNSYFSKRSILAESKTLAEFFDISPWKSNKNFCRQNLFKRNWGEKSILTKMLLLIDVKVLGHNLQKFMMLF